MLKNYFKIAWRNLVKNKVYSFINISGLSLGLACAMLIILYVKDEVSYDRFHEDGEHIYRIVSQIYNESGVPDGMNSSTGFLQGPRFTEDIPDIKEYVRIQSARRDVKIGAEVVSRDLFYADPNFFSMFTFPVTSGNPKTCLSEPFSVVISEELALTQFGTTNAVGKTMMFRDNEDFVPYTVTAVSQKSPQNSSIKFDMLLPLQVSEKDLSNNFNWFNSFLNTFVSLRPGANVSLVNDKMQDLYLAHSAKTAKIIKEQYGNNRLPPKHFLQPFTDMHLNKELPAQNGLTDASNPTFSYILSGIALFILLIACINFVNLTVARSVRRSQEIGIRKVVGGKRKQLVFQFLGESFLLCFFSFTMAILLVQLALPIFNGLANKQLSLSFLFDAKLVLGYVALFAITGVLAGFYPALVLSRYSPVDTLYSRFILSGKNYLQKSLVVLQFTLASLLIICTFVIYEQFNFLTTQELGYDDTDLVLLQKNNLTPDEFDTFKARLASHGNILDVAGKNAGYWFTVAKVGTDKQIDFANETVNQSYIPTLGIQLKEGRNFSDEHPSDATQSVLVNEAFVKEAGWNDPIGQTVDFWYNDEKYTVIGVVKDYHYESLGQTIRPQLFTMKPSYDLGMLYIKIAPGSATSSIANIEKVFRDMFPFDPYSYHFLEDQNYQSYEAEAKWKQIMLFSAILTIFISCIGLFGLSVLSAEKRTREIGIRKVLGASINNVVAILSKDFIKLVLAALLISIPVAWTIANKWLENYPYRIQLGWQVFAIASLLVILIALSTISFQSIRAAVANPSDSLKTQ
jgi:putative ABC transport system permease protein